MPVLRVLRCECSARHLLALAICDVDESETMEALSVEMTEVKCPICQCEGPHRIVPFDQSFDSQKEISKFMTDEVFDGIQRIKSYVAALN